MQLEIITKEDLKAFRLQLLDDIAQLLKQNPVKPSAEWLRSKDVRNMLGISPSTLQNIRISGHLKPTKINGSYFYRSKEVTELLESGSKMEGGI
jgi:hypothetical protein